MKATTRQSKKIKKADRYAFFPAYCKELIGRAPISEHQFHETRKWRFDFAFTDLLVAIEVEGGFFSAKGRHSSGAGARGDMEKYNAATERGWVILRYMPEHLERRETFTQISNVLRMRQQQILRPARVTVEGTESFVQLAAKKILKRSHI